MCPAADPGQIPGPEPFDGVLITLLGFEQQFERGFRIAGRTPPSRSEGRAGSSAIGVRTSFGMNGPMITPSLPESSNAEGHTFVHPRFDPGTPLV